MTQYTTRHLVGREVRVLDSGPKPAGQSAVAVDLGGLPSGLYTYRLLAGGQAATQRLAVVE